MKLHEVIETEIFKRKWSKKDLAVKSGVNYQWLLKQSVAGRETVKPSAEDVQRLENALGGRLLMQTPGDHDSWYFLPEYTPAVSIAERSSPSFSEHDFHIAEEVRQRLNEVVSEKSDIHSSLKDFFKNEKAMQIYQLTIDEIYQLIELTKPLRPEKRYDFTSIITLLGFIRRKD